MRTYRNIYHDFLSLLNEGEMLVSELCDDIDLDPHGLNYYINRAERDGVLLQRKYCGGQLYSLRVRSWPTLRRLIATTFYGPNAAAKKRGAK